MDGKKRTARELNHAHLDTNRSHITAPPITFWSDTNPSFAGVEDSGEVGFFLFFRPYETTTVPYFRGRTLIARKSKPVCENRPRAICLPAPPHWSTTDDSVTERRKPRSHGGDVEDSKRIWLVSGTVRVNMPTVRRTRRRFSSDISYKSVFQSSYAEQRNSAAFPTERPTITELLFQRLGGHFRPGRGP